MDKYIDNQALRVTNSALFTTDTNQSIADMEQASALAVQQVSLAIPVNKIAVFDGQNIMGANETFPYNTSKLQKEIYIHVVSCAGTTNVVAYTTAEEQISPMPIQNLQTSVITTAITTAGWYKIMCPAIETMQLKTIAASNCIFVIQELSN